MFWGVVLAATAITYYFHRSTAHTTSQGSGLMALIEPVVRVSPLAFYLGLGGIGLVAFASWLRNERRLGLPLKAAMPRWTFATAIVIGAHFAAWKYWLEPISGLEWLVIYSSATGILHFLYDGWIWKVRRPEVRQPIMAV